MEGRQGVERKGNGKGGMGRKREGKREEWSGRGERVGKGKGGLDLDICPWAPEFLVTPLQTVVFTLISISLSHCLRASTSRRRFLTSSC